MNRLLVVASLALLVSGCGEQKTVHIVSDIERGDVFVDKEKIGEIRVGYLTTKTSSGDHEIKVMKETSDGEWIFAGEASLKVEGDKASTVIELETKKIPTKKREERLAKAEADKLAKKTEIENKKHNPPSYKFTFSEGSLASSCGVTKMHVLKHTIMSRNGKPFAHIFDTNNQCPNSLRKTSIGNWLVECQQRGSYFETPSKEAGIETAKSACHL